MNKAKRLHNLSQGERALEILVATGFNVHQFSEYHFRVGGRLDVWPTSKKWYDTKAHCKGTYDNLELFVQDHFNEREQIKNQQE